MIHTTVILAMSADGKITDTALTAARFGSANDKSHLEQQVAASDAVLFGNGTLRAYGTTLRVFSPDLLEQRKLQGKPPQPVQIVCSRSRKFDPNWRFFQQPVPRWLLTGNDTDVSNRLEACSTIDELSCGTGILPVAEHGLEARSTIDELSCGTGILPVAEHGLEARSTIDELSCGTGILPVAEHGLEARSTIDELSCGTGILPVAEHGLEARSTIDELSCGTGILPVAEHGLEARSTIDELSCGTGILPVLENGAIGKFDRTLTTNTIEGEIDWIDAFQQLETLGIKRLAILGGGKLVASVLAAGLIDELWLTVCPLILGGVDAPTPVEGKGFLADLAPKLELLTVKQVGGEVFLHYRVGAG